MPYFAHVSLILAPDRSKLSKRHGATSVGQVVNHFISDVCFLSVIFILGMNSIHVLYILYIFSPHFSME